MRLNLFIFASLIFNLNANAQSLVNDSLEGFDYVHFKEHLAGIKDKAERKDYLNKVQRNYLKRKYDLNPK